MKDEVVIDDSNLGDYLDQDLEGLKALLSSEDMNIDTTPEPLDISSCGKELEGHSLNNGSNKTERLVSLPDSKREEISYKICRCGNIIYKNHKSEFRCGSCGCILY